MNITINGKARQMAKAQNLSQLVASYYKQPKHVITELNGNIVPPNQWTQTNIQDGDTLELVTFVGGG
jgi:thiamine biosynthesis protein ThiS